MKMKIFKKIILFVVLILGMNNVFSQKVLNQAIDKPTEGKSLVYFLRSGAGPLLNFRIYDKEVFLGAINGGKYLVYECEPGQHVFWATSENRDFVEANLEANSVYVLNVEGQMGAFIASVNLKPLKPTEFRDKKLLYQVVKNNDKVLYAKSNDDKSESIKKGLEKYDELKAKNSDKIGILTADMKFENADKPLKN